jgi:hypothetical protein
MLKSFEFSEAPQFFLEAFKGRATAAAKRYRRG